MCRPDDSLVTAARAGDDAAFTELVKANLDATWRLAHLLLNDRHAAEDATQETFVRAHAKLDTFRGDAPFRSWVLTICRRICLDRLRKKSFDTVPVDVVSLAAEPDGSDLRVDLGRAVARLADAEREAFVLVHVLGNSREDAAAIAGVPASTMRSRLARACDRLATELATDPMEAR